MTTLVPAFMVSFEFELDRRRLGEQRVAGLERGCIERDLDLIFFPARQGQGFAEAEDPVIGIDGVFRGGDDQLFHVISHPPAARN